MTSTVPAGPCVGVLCMATTDPLDIPGALRRAGTLPLPPDPEPVPEAENPSVSDTPVAQAYRAAAARLVARGAAFVTTDCGWNIEIADEIRSGCAGVPALPSILHLLPLLANVFPTVGIVSIRAWRLREVIASVGLDRHLDSVRIEGVSEDGQWRTVGTDAQAAAPALEDELVHCGSTLVRRDGASALLLDCTGFVPFTAAVQARCGVPTFGLGGLVHYLMGSGVR